DTEREVEPVEENPTLADLMEQPPMASNIVPFSSADFYPKIGRMKDPSANSALERATVEELNAALAAAFQRVVKY
ncbi:MAG: hypothetical protein ACOYMN_12320, partial [Roseimicrobium sp.]